MNQMGAALKKMQMDIDGLTKWRENLTHLQKLLHQQTGVYKQKYFQVCYSSYICCLPIGTY